MSLHATRCAGDNASGGRWFETTNWGLVLEAGDEDPERAMRAMEWLCSRYWHPVHAHVRSHIRRFGNASGDAEDLTQGFFEFAIERHLIQRARQEKGRFRSFILCSLDNYLHNWQDRVSALKRGGGVQTLSLETCQAERSLEDAFEDGRGAAGLAFDRRWAMALIRKVMENLRSEFAKREKEALHQALLPYLTVNPTTADYERIAAELQMEAGTVRVCCFRFRRRFGEILRREVAQTVAEPDEVEDEIRHLLSVLAEV